MAHCVQRMQERVFCVNKARLLDISQRFVSNLSKERKPKGPISNNLPGKAWMQSFVTRSNCLRNARAQMLEDKRAEAMNRSNLADFCAKLALIREKCGIGDSRARNCDESGISPREVMKGRNHLAILNAGRSELRASRIPSDAERANAAAVLRSNGTHSPPFAISKGTKFRCGHAADDRSSCQALHKALPPDSALAMAPPGGMEAEAWIEHSRLFARQASRLTQSNRKALLIAGGHSPHAPLEPAL